MLTPACGLHVRALSGCREEVFAGGGSEVFMIPWRAATAFALPKELTLDRVARSIVDWELRKFSFHFEHVLAVVGI